MNRGYDNEYISSDNMTDEEYLMHYGMPRRSGRYPWGSGKETYQRTADFLARIDEFKKQGMSEKDIATAFGLTTGKLRIQQSMAKAERRAIDVDRATALKAKGMSNPQIAKEMGLAGESSVRSLLNEKSCQRMNEAANVAALLKKHIDEKGMIDVGAGVERELGTTKEKLEQALYMLEMEGYPHYSGGVAQVTNAGKQTTIKVIGPPGTEHRDIYDYSKVNTIKDYNTMTGEVNVDPIFKYPTSVNGKRVGIRYAEDGGVNLDGTIEIRRGVQDLDLGGSHYSQVRILVDDKSYLKGMAVYKPDSNFPDGVDIMFNTNKAKGTPAEKVFKDISKNLEKDPTNPFGSAIKDNGQSYYIDKKTGERKLSAINKRADEGDWNDWSKGLPSQFLAKQSLTLIKKQLGLSKADKLAELEEIMAITNPTVKKNLLASFAEDADTAAADLKAASLPRQKYQVILPINSVKDSEVYAPNFKDGEKVALIRFPHGGLFEIPILTVNNKNKDAIEMIGKNPKDAVCINSKNAERLSGADFDGDTVLVLPTGGSTKILSKNPLKELENFDNKKEYPAKPGMKVMQKGSVGREMGMISNLITDMTLQGATDSELARAVKHSMVVIDAEKHKLDYKKSEQVNGIAALQKKYQPANPEAGKNKDGGASTLLSKSKGVALVEKRVGTPKINIKGKEWYDPSQPEGALIYNVYKNVKGAKGYDPSQPEGSYIKRAPQLSSKGAVLTDKSKKMLETNDARTLMSGPKNEGTPQERLYADYANSLKAMANTARKAYATTPKLEYSPDAHKAYKADVSSLMAKLNTALLNAPKERQAQLLTNSIIKQQTQDNEIDKDKLKKMKQQALTKARAQFGAKRETIEITDSEWEAIQKGAISENQLTKILQNADVDSLRSKATPRSSNTLSSAKLSLLQSMKNSGYTNQEIAERLGVSASTVARY